VPSQVASWSAGSKDCDWVAKKRDGRCDKSGTLDGEVGASDACCACASEDDGGDGEDAGAGGGDCGALQATLDHVNGMLTNHTTKLVAPVGASSLGHGVDPDDFDVLDDLQVPNQRRLDEDDSPGVLGLPPNYVASMERMSFVVPFDWECQAGTSGGVYPCPMGVPSTCRANRPGGLSAACAKCACASAASAGHACCKYYDGDAYVANGLYYSNFTCPAALQTGGTDLLVDTTVNVCVVDELVEALWDDGEFYLATVTAVSGSEITVRYTDDDTSTYGLLDEGSVLQFSNGGDCVQTCDAATVESQYLWGPHWWKDEDIGTSYVNFKVTRYEMADSFGVEFYSTEGDTVKVFSTGDVHFKPTNAKRTIYVNEQVEYDYGDAEDAERRLASTADALKDIDLTVPIETDTFAAARHRHHTGHQAAAAGPDVDAGPKGPAKRRADDTAADEAKPRLGHFRRSLKARRGGGFLSTTGSFTLSSGSNTAGND